MTGGKSDGAHFPPGEREQPCTPSSRLLSPPTLIAGVRPDAQTTREKTFGPLAGVISFERYEQVIGPPMRRRPAPSSCLPRRSVGEAG